jgi:hypothetical protein
MQHFSFVFDIMGFFTDSEGLFINLVVIRYVRPTSLIEGTVAGFPALIKAH